MYTLKVGINATLFYDAYASIPLNMFSFPDTKVLMIHSVHANLLLLKS